MGKPLFLRLIEDIAARSGRSGDDITRALGRFFSARQAAPAAQRVTQQAVERAPAAVVRSAAQPVSRPVAQATRPAVETRQLDLMDALAEQTKRGELRYKGKFQAPTGPKDVNVETVRASLGATPPPASRSDLLQSTRPVSAAPGQLDLMVPLGPSSELIEPGRLDSLRDLAATLSRRTGLPADDILVRLTGPGGADYGMELGARNALQNLVTRIQANPNISRAIYAGGAGGLSLGAVIRAQQDREADLRQQEQDRLSQAQLYPKSTEGPLGPEPVIRPDGSLAGSSPEVSAPLVRPLGADSSEPAVVARRPVMRPLGATPGEPAAAPAPVAQKPLGAPTPGTDIEAYYQARSAYASQPAVRAELMQFAMRGLTGKQAQAMGEWAKANPALAYELQRRSMADPDQSLQSGQNVQSKALSTQLGTDNVNNAQGSADSVSQSILNPSAGAFDMMSATEPLEKPVLLSQHQARDYAEGSLKAGETFADKLLRMAALRNQLV